MNFPRDKLFLICHRGYFNGNLFTMESVTDVIDNAHNFINANNFNNAHNFNTANICSIHKHVFLPTYTKLATMYGTIIQKKLLAMTDFKKFIQFSSFPREVALELALYFGVIKQTAEQLDDLEY